MTWDNKNSERRTQVGQELGGGIPAASSGGRTISFPRLPSSHKAVQSEREVGAADKMRNVYLGSSATSLL